MLLANTILQNRYRVLRELGHGGMGTVYEALDQRVNCIVALKETSTTNDVGARRAFEREASLLANLRHSSLPKVMDYFIEGDAVFLIMEFVPGHDLAELLEQRGTPFTQAEVLSLADDVLKVLEYLHGQQPPILHRDIKPANLKLTKQGEVFLLDFGLAKGSAGQMSTELTSRSVQGYTPIYASLEQIHGLGSDPRSDVYSLSATLYHLLTGVAPKAAPTRFIAVEDEQPDPLPPIEELNPDVSPNIACVIYRAMAIHRRHRPCDAAEMRKALNHAAEQDGLILGEVPGIAALRRQLSEEERIKAEAETRPLDLRLLRQPVEEDLELGLVWVPPGDFLRGSDHGDADERPAQLVTISRGFYLGRCPVTQAQWQMVMGNNPSHFISNDRPVEQISWADAAAFITQLNERNDGFVYRLPSEAEWEYACRAGTTGDYAGDLDATAWHKDNSAGTTHAVGTKLPNAFGLFDMNGNVWEWCEDSYHDNYEGAPTDGSAWLSSGDGPGLQVLRGGSWDYPATALRSAVRNRNFAYNRLNDNGFRLCARPRA